MKAATQRLIVALLAGAGMHSGAALSQAFPSKPVQIIVPFAPGGSVDITMRVLGPALQENLGQPVLIVNRPGGAATIGMRAVASATPDGYTLGAASLAFAANPPFMVGKMPYNTERDFAPVTMVAKSALAMMVHPSVPARTVKEFVDYVKANPGKVNYGSVGIASSGHIFTALFESMTGIGMTHVPYNTSPLPGLANGDIQLQFGPIPSSLPFIRSNKVVPIAVTSLTPDPALPGVPTVASTVPGFEVFEWPSLVSAAGTPPAVIRRLQQDTAKAVASPDVKKRFDDLSTVAVANSPEEFGAFIKQQIGLWGKVAADIIKRDPKAASAF